MLATALVLAQNSPSNPSSQNSTKIDPETGQPRAEKPQSGATNGVTVATATEIRATLDTPLSSKTSRPGDRFTATIQEPVRAADGGTAIPSGALVHGSVAEVTIGTAVPGRGPGGHLNLRFREVVLPDGTRAPLNATLVSVRQTNGTGPVRAQATGAIAGLTFEAPMKGLHTEGGAVRNSDGKDVNLPANSGLVLRLDQPLNLQRTASPGK
jgi:hypothetical protein